MRQTTRSDVTLTGDAQKKVSPNTWAPVAQPSPYIKLNITEGKEEKAGVRSGNQNYLWQEG